MNNLWIFLAFASMLLTSSKVIFMGLISKFNYNKQIMICILYIILGLFGLTYASYLYFTLPSKDINKIKKMNFKEISIFIIFGFLYIVTSGVALYSFAFTPNIAYTHSIINLNILITILASIIIFKQELNNITLFGMILSLVGIIILINYSNK
jgi:drug/metabolite transporter (DMT)-like permease